MPVVFQATLVSAWLSAKQGNDTVTRALDIDTQTLRQRRV